MYNLTTKTVLKGFGSRPFYTVKLCINRGKKLKIKKRLPLLLLRQPLSI